VLLVAGDKALEAGLILVALERLLEANTTDDVGTNVSLTILNDTHS
jgi:hypothetical protein